MKGKTKEREFLSKQFIAVNVFILFIITFQMPGLPDAVTPCSAQIYNQVADTNGALGPEGVAAIRIIESGNRLIKTLEKGEAIESHIDNVIRDISAFEVEDAESLRRFGDTEDKLKSTGSSKAWKRHREALDKYRARATEVKGHIEAVKEARKKKAQEGEIKQRIVTLVDSLEKDKLPYEYKLKDSSRLPWRVAEPGEIALLGNAPVVSGSAAQPLRNPPASDDLSPTPDVQITPEVQALAKSLGNDPLTIFRYVYNNYSYTPYYGSVKGSVDTYWEKEGNDYDLSSLLIALLRASNVPARYVKTKARVSAEKLMKITGINDPMAAMEYLDMSEVPVGYYASGGIISHVEVEHVYVEAYIPYGNYRGTGEDDTGKIWVPLDVSFKEIEPVQEGTDIASQMGFDWKAFSNEYLGGLVNMTPLDYYRGKVGGYVSQTYPGQSIDSLKRVDRIRTKLFDFIPGTLPYETVGTPELFSAIPNEQRHYVRFTIPEVLDYAASLPEVSGRRLTLSFEGADAEDQALIEAYGGIFKTPPYLIEVRPILRIDGIRAAEGTVMSAGIGTGFSITYTRPGGKTEVFDHHITTGSFNAVGITTGRVRPEFLTIAQVEPSEEPYIAKMLHSLVMKYHDRQNIARQTLGDTMKIKSRMLISEALVSSREDIKWALGMTPMSFEMSGFMIDAKEMVSGIMPVDGYDRKKIIDFAMVSGHEASYQENAVFEDSMFWVSGLSAVKGLQMLKAMGINVIELEPHTTYMNYALPEVVIEDINNALNMGWRVIAPETTGGLPAVPFIKYDPETGSAGYMIAARAGGLNWNISPITHEEDLTFIKDALEQSGLLRINFEILDPLSPYIAAMGDYFIALLRVVVVADAYAVQVVKEKPVYFDTDYRHYKQGQWPLYAVSPGQYKYKFDGRELLRFHVAEIIVTNEAPSCGPLVYPYRCGESFVARRDRTGDTLKATVIVGTNANVTWTCNGTAPNGGNNGNCNSLPGSGTGPVFSFIPNPPQAASGRTLPLSYQLKATVDIGTMSRDITKVITQDGLDELRQEYEDLPQRDSQERSCFDKDVPTYDALLGLNAEPDRHEWHILRLHNLNQHAVDTDNNFISGDLRVTSGYRCPIGNQREVNRGAGSMTSNHQYGRAFDFNQQSSGDNYDAFDAARNVGAGGDSYLRASNGTRYFLRNGFPPSPGQLPSGVSYVQGHVAWQ
ncbi:MAG: hypothetical protein HZB33_07925 [Nitrospirae bacterium]|nr:hypothetical protein [Nitrospirota bacterium]